MKPPRRSPLRAVLLAALSALALPAFADDKPAWFEAGVKDWSENLLPAEAFGWIKFKDEENIERTLYCRKSPHKYMSFNYETGCQLYAFPVAPAPEREVREMESEWCYGKETMSVDLAIVKNAQVSPYYIAEWNGNGGLIGRRDRAETRLPTYPLNGSNYYSESGIHPWPPTQWSKKAPEHKILACNGVNPWGRIQVYKPTAVGGASKSPLTATQPYETCGNISSLWKQGSEDWRQIYRGWMPQEFELWVGALDPAVATPGIWTETYNAARAAVAKGDYGPAAQYHKWYREQAKKAVGNIGTASAASGAPKDRFLPLESKFLTCRANHLGRKTQFFDAISKVSGDAGKTEAFVSLWRQYVQRELEQYLKDAALAPVMPRLPENGDIEKGLTERFDATLAAKLSAPSTAKKESGPAKTPAKKAISLPDAADVFK